MCYWPEVLGVCGETFYGLMFALSTVGLAASVGLIFGLVFAFDQIKPRTDEREGS